MLAPEYCMGQYERNIQYYMERSKRKIAKRRSKNPNSISFSLNEDESLTFVDKSSSEWNSGEEYEGGEALTGITTQQKEEGKQELASANNQDMRKKRTKIDRTNEILMEKERVEQEIYNVCYKSIICIVEKTKLKCRDIITT